MASIFTRIMNDEIPGRFVWKDERCAAFLTIEPLRPGHTLVVPRQEVDHWIDLKPGLADHLMQTSQSIGKAIHRAFACEKVAFIILGLEVPHVHIHLTPIDSVGDVDWGRLDRKPKPEDLDAAAKKIREALGELGYKEATF